MHRKPWSIVLLSLVFFLIPIFNIIMTYFTISNAKNFDDYLYNLAFNPNNHSGLFDMVVPSLVACFAIYNVKKWSYPLFLSAMFWIILKMFYIYSNQISFFGLILTMLIPMLINILFVSYILLPNVRAAYFDPKMRWWETAPRYIFSNPVKINLDGGIILGNMTNISIGGLFINIMSPLKPDTLISISFDIFDTHFLLNSKVVYCKSNEFSYGLQFLNITNIQKKSLKKIIKKLADENYETTCPTPIWTEDLTKWFLTLIKTGKGFTP